MDNDPGVSLAHYRAHGADVLLACLDCQRQWTVPLDDVIARLEARGVGGPQTGIREVSRLVTKPCARCGSWRLESRPAFPPGERKT